MVGTSERVIGEVLKVPSVLYVRQGEYHHTSYRKCTQKYFLVIVPNLGLYQMSQPMTLSAPSGAYLLNDRIIDLVPSSRITSLS
jgi:hypothetical protein